MQEPSHFSGECLHRDHGTALPTTTDERFFLNQLTLEVAFNDSHSSGNSTTELWSSSILLRNKILDVATGETGKPVWTLGFGALQRQAINPHLAFTTLGEYKRQGVKNSYIYY